MELVRRLVTTGLFETHGVTAGDEEDMHTLPETETTLHVD